MTSPYLSTMPPVFRFAPSPNGYLHLGHALSALLNADMARAAGGRLLLRIEDIDATRCRPEYEAAIDEDLHWLGLAWEEPVRRQSEHFADYRAALERLGAMGLVYPSFESRAEIAALAVGHDPDGAPLYPGTAKAMSAAARAQRMACGATWPRRRRGCRNSPRTKPAPATPATTSPIPPPGATSFSRARIRRPAITSPALSTMPRRA